jgi:hypothetical protein
MQRKVLDQIASGVGAVIVVVLLVAGGLLTWGYTFAHSNVHDQLAQQQIFFPPKSAFDHPKAGTEITPSMIPSVSQYAGQQVLTGQQAQVYANDFIAVHLSEMPYGGVYANVSAAARAATPGSARAKQLSALETTVFQGTTLRGLLLQAYAFGTIATLLFWGAIASFVLALIMAVLVIGGIWHARRTTEDKRVFATGAVPAL